MAKIRHTTALARSPVPASTAGAAANAASPAATGPAAASPRESQFARYQIKDQRTGPAPRRPALVLAKRSARPERTGRARQRGVARAAGAQEESDIAGMFEADDSGEPPIARARGADLQGGGQHPGDGQGDRQDAPASTVWRTRRDAADDSRMPAQTDPLLHSGVARLPGADQLGQRGASAQVLRRALSQLAMALAFEPVQEAGSSMNILARARLLLLDASSPRSAPRPDLAAIQEELRLAAQDLAPRYAQRHISDAASRNVLVLLPLMLLGSVTPRTALQRGRAIARLAGAFGMERTR